MNCIVDFVCKGEIPEEIPQAIIDSAGVSYISTYTEREAMAVVAQKLKEINGDSICRVPLCTTVEAEALGASLSIPDDRSGPRIEGYPFTSLEELVEVPEIDLEAGRIKEVLESIELLNRNYNTVALNIMGPFSVLGLLVNPITLFKGINKQREMVQRVLQRIENGLLNYALKGVEKGAKIISFADPTGALDLVGPQFYQDISGRSSLSLLKSLQGRLYPAVVHLCWKTSLAFEKVGYCSVSPVEVAEGITYGQALCQVLKSGEVSFVGHRCLKSTTQRMKNPIIWKIDLV